MTDSPPPFDPSQPSAAPPPLPGQIVDQGTAEDPDGPLDLHRRDSHTLDAGRTFDEGTGRIFPCESCGADLEFHIGDQ